MEVRTTVLSVEQEKELLRIAMEEEKNTVGVWSIYTIILICSMCVFMCVCTHACVCVCMCAHMCMNRRECV